MTIRSVISIPDASVAELEMFREIWEKLDTDRERRDFVINHNLTITYFKPSRPRPAIVRRALARAR